MDKYSLVGVNGNAYFIMGYVLECMSKEGKNQEEKKDYLNEARKLDYDNLLVVSANMIEKLNEK